MTSVHAHEEAEKAYKHYILDWDSDPGTREVQALKTSVQVHLNEVQMVSTTTLNSDERQIVRSYATPIGEVQRIVVKNSVSGQDGSATGHGGGSFSLLLDTTSMDGGPGSVQRSGDIEVGYPASSSGGTVRRSVASIISRMANVGVTVTVTKNVIDFETYEYLVTFPSSMGDVPQLTADVTKLEPKGKATVNISTERQGNVIEGTFTLLYKGTSTTPIRSDATEAEVRAALETIEAIREVQVTRGPRDAQHGYAWTVDFTSLHNDGDLAALVPEYTTSLTTTSTSGCAMSVTSTHGNQLEGTFDLSYGGDTTRELRYDATSTDVKNALEQLSSVPTGTLAVTRSGPDGQRGYNWTVEFLHDAAGTFQGDLSMITASYINLLGTDSKVVVSEVHKGSEREVQQLTVAVGLNDAPVNGTTWMRLRFKEETTTPIRLNQECEGDAQVTEIQRLTLSTVNTVDLLSVDDSEVSPYSEFRLMYTDVVHGTENTAWLPALGQGCVVIAASIETALERFAAFANVNVVGTQTGDSLGCHWDVDFSSSAGDVQLLTVAVRNTATGEEGSAGVSSTAGYDTIAVTQTRFGQKESIKGALEGLTNVGKVTVAAAAQQRDLHGACTWRVTFESKAGSGDGDIPLLEVSLGMGANFANPGRETAFNTAPSLDDAEGDTTTVTVARITPATTAPVDGFFRLRYEGAITPFLPYDISARRLELALEALDTITDVSVSRSIPDENQGYTWHVTFNSETGDVQPLAVDVDSMTGTRVSGMVSQVLQGAVPGFNSAGDGTPLGSRILPIGTASVTVSDLNSEVPYYFRLSALTTTGASTGYSYPVMPYAVPLLTAPSSPQAVALTVTGATTARVDFTAPEADGGSAVTAYRVTYGASPIVHEVQEVSLTCAADHEVQTLTTTTTGIDEVQMIMANTTWYAWYAPATEIQRVRCDASGGSFTLAFGDAVSTPIEWDATASDISTALKTIPALRNITVAFGIGTTQACFQEPDQPTADALGFLVSFTDVPGDSANYPLMVSDSNALEGLRLVSVTQEKRGAGPLKGTFRVTYNGDETDDIPVTASADDMKTALEGLAGIDTGAVTVGTAHIAQSKVWTVTFNTATVTGNVAELGIHPAHNRVSGSDAVMSTSTISQGAVMGGTFALRFRGHSTGHMPFDVSADNLRSALSALPTTGNVYVSRTGPSHENEYSWAVTFASTPGSFPVGSFFAEESLLEVDDHALHGSMARVQTVPGSVPMAGAFELRFNAPDGSVGAATLLVDSTALEVQAALEALPGMGAVSVLRSDSAVGYTWAVTFNGCRGHTCNSGNVDMLQPHQGTATCTPEVREIVGGSGPGMCLGDAPCEVVVSSAAAGSSPSVIISGVIGTQAVYAQVTAVNTHGESYAGFPRPAFALPRANAPAAPPRPLLEDSTLSSITVRWAMPRDNGGADVAGYQLYAGEHGDESMRLVYDGAADATVTSFTVSAKTSMPLQVKGSYAFQVRAVNRCNGTAAAVCVGALSPVAVFVAKPPTKPAPPSKPYLSAKSTTRTAADGNSDVTIRWSAPLDNGGAAVRGYIVQVAEMGADQFQPYRLKSFPHIHEGANGGNVLEWTFNGVAGRSYRFFVEAYNDHGVSIPSPLLSTVAAVLPGYDMQRRRSYSDAAYAPSITSMGIDKVSLLWPMPAADATGGSAISGYQLYMYSDVPMGAQSAPAAVSQAVQAIRTNVVPRVPAVQEITLNGLLPGYVSISIYGLHAELTLDATRVEITTALRTMSTQAGRTFCTSEQDRKNACVDVDRHVTSAVDREERVWRITFADVDGPVEHMAVDVSRNPAILNEGADNEVVVTVATLQPGTSPVSGSFVVQAGDKTTIDLAHDVSARDLEAALEDLAGLGSVSVTRTRNLANNEDRAAYSWSITFDSLAGEVELLKVFGGRLGPLSSGVSIVAESVVPGTPATLIYDGTGMPSQRSVTVTDLEPGLRYAFRVAPMNAMGLGLMSAPTPAIALKQVAAADQTTLSGTALMGGYVDSVKEIQVLSTSECTEISPLTLDFGLLSVTVLGSASAADIQTALQDVLLTGAVHVTRSDDFHVREWFVTFSAVGDVALLAATSTDGNCKVSVLEVTPGRANEFTIEPRLMSGAALDDSAIASDQRGGDVFLTETYHVNGSWHKDHGVASYQPVVFDVQSLYIVGGVGSHGTNLTMDNYLADRSDVPTTFYSKEVFATSTADEVAAALEALPVIGAAGVTVSKTDASTTSPAVTASRFLVTFVGNHGDVPLLGVTNSKALVSQVQTGVTEIQTITVTSNTAMTPEVQLLTLSHDPTQTNGEISISLNGQTTSVMAYSNASDSFPTSLRTALGGLRYGSAPGSGHLDATVNLVSSDLSNPNLIVDTYRISFNNPTGDAMKLTVAVTTGTYTATVSEIQKGVNSLGGSFTLSLGGAYTDDIPADASSTTLKEALEELSSVGTISVSRTVLSHGFRWAITFVDQHGNIPALVASSQRYGVKRLSTTGGVPNPISGDITVMVSDIAVRVAHDASATALKTALEASGIVGDLEVSRSLPDNLGRYLWEVTFRSQAGFEVPMSVSTAALRGSQVGASVVTAVTGTASSVTDLSSIVVEELSAGKPDYKARYSVETPGTYGLQVLQLQGGGLLGEYFDNPYWYGAPALVRVDPQVSFDWGTGSVADVGVDDVSVRWSGKLRVAQTGVYTVHVTADDSAKLTLDHKLLLDISVACCVERSATITLTAGVYYDLVLEYVEHSDTASISLELEAPFAPKRVVSPEELFSATPVVGSPVTVSVKSGAVSATHTSISDLSGAASATARGTAVAGVQSSFMIQLKDHLGNIVTTDAGPATVGVAMMSTDDVTVSTPVATTYMGNGVYDIAYTPVFAGSHRMSLTLDGENIQCGVSSSSCSPFDVTVAPGAAVTYTTEAEVSAGTPRDFLVEAVAGELAYFTVVARDAFGNVRSSGGDNVQATVSRDDRAIDVYTTGVSTDMGDGSYEVNYQVPAAGTYFLSVSINGGDLTLCAGAAGPRVLHRRFDGTNAYRLPEHCSDVDGEPTTITSLRVVHGALHTGKSTFSGLDGQTAAVDATVSFSIYSRDAHGNLRSGDETSHSGSSGDGSTDVFTAEFTHDATGAVSTFTSAAGVRGKYELDYTLTTTGDYTVRVLSSLGDEELSGSPAAVHVVNGMVDASACSISGSGLEGGTAGTQLTVVLQTRDTGNNALDSNADLSALVSLDVTYEGGDDGVVDVLDGITFIGSGVYELKYTPVLKGQYTVRTKVEGQAVGAVAQVVVSAAAQDAAMSSHNASSLFVQGTSEFVAIQMRDVFGNQLGSGVSAGSKVEVMLTTTPHACVDGVKTTDVWQLITAPPFTDGLYVFRGAPVLAGAGTLSLTVDGKHVAGSPLAVEVYPGPVSEGHSVAQGAGLSTCVASEECSFTLSTKDVEGNSVFNSGAHDWSVSVGGVPAAIVPVGWTALGSAQVTFGSRTVATNSNFINKIERGVSLVLGAATVMVSTDEATAFDSTTITLTSPYLGRTGVVDGFLSDGCATGSYSVTYTPTTSGAHAIAIGSGVSNGAITVLVAPTATSAAQSFAFGAGLSSGKPGEAAAFTIQSRDEYSNDRLPSQGQDSYKVRAFAPAADFDTDGSTTPATSVAHMSGTNLYTAAFTPTLSGAHVVVVTLCNTGADGATHCTPIGGGDGVVVHEKQSLNLRCATGEVDCPFTLTFRGQTTSELSTATATAASLTSALEQLASVGAVSVVELQIDIFAIEFTPSAGESVAHLETYGDLPLLQVAASGSGSSNARHIVSEMVRGVYQYTSFVAPSDVHPSSTTVRDADALPGTRGLSSGIYQDAASFVIEPRDAFGNRVLESTVHFVATISDAEGGVVTHVDLAAGQQGLYEGSYVTPAPVPGNYSMDVQMAFQGGLTGEYFPNRHLMDEPAATSVDAVIDLSWGFNDAVTETVRDYVSVRWTGFVLPTHSETYTFYVKVNDGARLTVGGELLVDQFENSVKDSASPSLFTATTSAPLVAGRLVPIVLEFRENTGRASISLEWASKSQKRRVVPSEALFYGSAHVAGSPFALAPLGRKPDAVTDLSVAVAGWESLAVSFTQPSSDGGYPMESYTIEWFDAHPGSFDEPLEVQTIKVSNNVVGGVMRVGAPTGLASLYTLPFDADAAALKSMLEKIDGVGSVTVTTSSDDVCRMWSVTFVTGKGDIGTLQVDGTELVLAAAADSDTILICHDGQTGLVGGLVCNADESTRGGAFMGAGGSVTVTATDLDTTSSGDYVYILSGLEQDSAQTHGFAVRVFASNAAGFSGLASALVTAKPNGVPDAPLAVHVVAGTDDNSVAVYWSHVPYPSNRAADVTHYAVQWSASSLFETVRGEFIGATADLASVRVMQIHDDYGPKPVPTLTHNVTGLVPGETIYMRVCAQNLVGRSACSDALNHASSVGVTPHTRPSSIVDGGVKLSTVAASSTVSVLKSTSSLEVSFMASDNHHGSPVSNYTLHYATAPATNRVDEVSVRGYPNMTGGFTVSSGVGSVSDWLPVSASADAMRSAIESLRGVAEVWVTRAVEPKGVVWTVTYINDFLASDFTLTIDAAELMGCSYSGATTVMAGAPALKHSSVTIDAQPNISAYSYTLGDLQTGVEYFVWVTSTNAVGTSVAAASTPNKLAPPVQKPAAPLLVSTLPTSKSSLGVAWRHPMSDGGAAVTKFLVEWDTAATFNSNDGSPVGSFLVAPADTDRCKTKDCTYAISGLTKGTSYHVRVFAYNTMGFSTTAGFPADRVASPTSLPDAPALCSVAALPDGTLAVSVAAPVEDGGAPISHYKVEWGVVGAEAYDNVEVPAESLLYNDGTTQVIRLAASSNDISGSFVLAMDDVVAPSAVSVDTTAAQMEVLLSAIPSVGRVAVSRSSIDGAGVFGVAWTVTFLDSIWCPDSALFSVPPLAVTDDVLLVGTDVEVTVTTVVAAMAGYEMQEVRIATEVGMLEGSFQLSWTADETALTTGQLSVSISEVSLAAALEPLVGAVDVYRRSVVAGGHTVTYVLVYRGVVGERALVAVDSGLAVSDAAVAVTSSTHRLQAGALAVLSSERFYGYAVVNATETGTFTYVVEGLREALPYHVRVSAWNGVGGDYGAVAGGLPSVVRPARAPVAVHSISLTAVDATSVDVAWAEPTDSGGVPMASYTVEYDYASSNVEVQVVSVNGTQGSFALTMGAYSTADLSFDSDAHAVESALEALPVVGDVEVVRDAASSSFAVTFANQVGSVSLLHASTKGNGLTVDVHRSLLGEEPSFSGGSSGIHRRALGSITVAAPLKVVTVTATAVSSDLHGAFSIEMQGEQSTPVNVTASAADFQAAVESLLTVGAVSVTAEDLTMSLDGPVVGYGRRWRVTYSDARTATLLVGTGGRAAMSAVGGSLSGSEATVAVVVENDAAVPSHVLVTGLSAGRAVTVRVTGTNANGAVSEVAQSPLALVPAVAAPSAPTTAFMRAVSDTELVVWWTAPEQTGGSPLSGYTVEWDTSAAFTASPRMQYVTDLSEALTYRIGDLTVSTSYWVRVAAFNGIGYGPATPAVSSDAVGAPLGPSAVVLTALAVPASPTNVTVYPVSLSELGVHWHAPSTDGGSAVTDFVVEWDTSPFFLRQDAAHYPHSRTVSFAQARDFSVRANYSYQITGLPVQPIFVRVRAVNAVGTGRPGQGFPAASDDSCETMGIHCATTPAWQLPFLPTNTYAQLSYQDVHQRLEVSWRQPTVDMNGFVTTTDGHEPAVIPEYLIEWSTSAAFTSDSTNSSVYTMVRDENVTTHCQTNCSATIGTEVQNVTLSTGNNEPLTAGGFSLLYMGAQSRQVLVQTAAESTKLFMYSIDMRDTVKVGDFLQIRGGLYQVANASDEYGQMYLTTPFAGGFSDVLFAAYAPAPMSCLAYDASAQQVKTVLQGLFYSDYEGYGDAITVAKQSVSPRGEQTGVERHTWLVTFEGEYFAESVSELYVLSSLQGGFTHGCANFETSSGSALHHAAMDVSTVSQANTVAFGVPLFLRVSAFNGLGQGPTNHFDASVNGQGNDDGSITPRAPPGLPRDVKVFAIPTGVATQLRVTWTDANPHGSPISKYTIEWKLADATDFSLTQNVAMGTTGAYDVTIPVQANEDYIVRVRATNDRGQSGPRHYQAVPAWRTNDITAVPDYRSGAQRALPTCMHGLDECSEKRDWLVLSRGIPGAPPLSTPNYTAVVTEHFFSHTSARIVVGIPLINGFGTDKWRVEWDTASSFDSDDLQTVEITSPEYDITGLSMGQEYFIRAFAHHSGGYGAASLSYPFKPHRQPDAPSAPVVTVSEYATSMEEFATTLNVTWMHPTVDATDPYGAGGDPVTEYLLEWSQRPFSEVVHTVQTIEVECLDSAHSLEGNFSMSLTTLRVGGGHHEDTHFHWNDFSVTGTYITALVDHNAGADTFKTALENLDNVAEVTVAVDTSFITGSRWTVTFEETNSVPTLVPVISNLRCGPTTPTVTVTTTTPGSFAGSDTYTWTRVAAVPSLEQQQYTITNLVPSKTYYTQVSARNDLGFGARRVTAPAGITVPVTRPSLPTQLEAGWEAPKIFRSGPNSIVVKVGPPSFDGGAPVSTYNIEWDTSADFNTGPNAGPLGAAAVGAFTELCANCVSAIDFDYNDADTDVTVTYWGSTDDVRQLQSGSRVTIITADDDVPYTFEVAGGGAEPSRSEFKLASSGLRENVFEQPPGPLVNNGSLRVLGCAVRDHRPYYRVRLLRARER